MPQFEIGLLSFVLAAFFSMLYCLKFLFRKVAAWSTRSDQPKDRVGFFILVWVVFGFILGCFAQPLWTQGMACKHQGKPMANCLFLQLR